MSGKITYRWNGDRFRRELEAEMGRRTRASAIAVHNQAKKLVSTEGAGKTAPGRNSAGKFTKGKLIYGANPSKPGEPPHVQTGRLRGSIAWEMASQFVARVGTNLLYGRWIELGTRWIAARPWLRRSLVEMKPRIVRLMTTPFRFKGPQ